MTHAHPAVRAAGNRVPFSCLSYNLLVSPGPCSWECFLRLEMFSGLPLVARKHLTFMQQSAGLSFHTYYRAFSAHPPSPPFLFLSGGISLFLWWRGWPSTH